VELLFLKWKSLISRLFHISEDRCLDHESIIHNTQKDAAYAYHFPHPSQTPSMHARKAGNNSPSHHLTSAHQCSYTNTPRASTRALAPYSNLEKNSSLYSLAALALSSASSLYNSKSSSPSSLVLPHKSLNSASEIPCVVGAVAIAQIPSL